MTYLEGFVYAFADGGLLGIEPVGSVEVVSGTLMPVSYTHLASPTAGNFAGLDANGNPTDSGKKPGDFADASHCTTPIKTLCSIFALR